MSSLEVEEDCSAMPTLALTEGSGWENGAVEGLEKQIFEVRTWRQMRGPAGAVMCETRDLGVKLPHWHTLLFERQVVVDTRVVCPQDVKMMLLKQVRRVHSKTATLECELKGVWAEPIQAVSN